MHASNRAGATLLLPAYLLYLLRTYSLIGVLASHVRTYCSTLLLQEQLYYLLAPSRDSALASAYMEALKAKDLEVSRQW